MGVHRVRLIANELHGLDWKATVLAVHEDDYEEELVPETTQTGRARGGGHQGESTGQRPPCLAGGCMATSR